MSVTEGHVICACGKRLAVFVPKGGDGALLVVKAHGPAGDRCPGSWDTFEWTDVLENPTKT